MDHTYDEIIEILSEIQEELNQTECIYNEVTDDELIEAYAYKCKYLQKVMEYWRRIAREKKTNN